MTIQIVWKNFGEKSRANCKKLLGVLKTTNITLNGILSKRQYEFCGEKPFKK